MEIYCAAMENEYSTGCTAEIYSAFQCGKSGKQIRISRKNIVSNIGEKQEIEIQDDIANFLQEGLSCCVFRLHSDNASYGQKQAYRKVLLFFSPLMVLWWKNMVPNFRHILSFLAMLAHNGSNYLNGRCFARRKSVSDEDKRNPGLRQWNYWVIISQEDFAVYTSVIAPILESISE